MIVGVDFLPFKCDIKRRGISNYIYYLSKYIFKDNVIQFEVFNCPEEVKKEFNSDFPNVNFFNFPIDPLLSSRLDVFFYTSFFDFNNDIVDPQKLNCKTVGIVYDLIPLIFHEAYFKHFPEHIKLEYFRRLYYISKLDRVVTMSESAKTDLHEISHYPLSKIDVISSGVSKKIQAKSEKKKHVTVSEREISKYIYSIPSMDIRKNIQGILESYFLLPSEIKNEYMLVITCELSKSVEAHWKKFIKNNKFSSHVIFTNYIPDEKVNELLANADVFIFPSYYEGFGLPIIEAMAYGVPVVTSRGSSLEEIAANAAALVDPGDYSGISDAINKIINDDDYKKSLIDAGFERLKYFSWEKTAKKLLRSFELANNTIAMATTWNVRCGIAEYSKNLIENCENLNVLLLAAAEEEKNKLSKINSSYFTAWEKNSADLDRVLEILVRKKIKLLHIQFNFSLFRLDAIENLFEKMRFFNIKIVITFHSVQDTEVFNRQVSLRSYISTLNLLDLIILHKKSDFEYIQNLGVKNNIIVIPQGVNSYISSEAQSLVSRQVQMVSSPIISMFGFLLPHKGCVELIEALSLLRKAYPAAKLQLICALYPSFTSESYLLKCERLIKKYKLREQVMIESDFKPESAIMEKLITSDLIVLPYKHTKESSSAAIRMCLAAKRPLIVTDIPIFDEFENEVFKIKNTEPRIISDAVSFLLNNKSLCDGLIKSVDNWVNLNSWSIVGKNYSNYIAGFL